MDKPSTVLLRDREWAALARFAQGSEENASLALVSGRRRVGKSYLLAAAVEAVGGLHHALRREEPAQALRRLAVSYAELAGGPRPAFEDWSEAIDALVALGRTAAGPVLVVLDEVPYAFERDPAMPSHIQAALGPGGPGSGSRTRLVLCGSAVSVMRQLGGGREPLRGRASLELDVRPFDLVETAAFSGLVDDPYAALLLYAATGGVAGYLGIMAGTDRPAGRADVGRWMAEGPLNPQTSLFREGQALLAEDADIVLRARGLGLYEAIMQAVADGHTTASGISRALGRTMPELSQPLAVLVAAQLLRRTGDPLRANRPTYAPDPFLRFHYTVARPHAERLLRGVLEPTAAWRDALDTGRFASQVLGPTWEEVARDLVVRAGLAPSTAKVGPTVVGDRGFHAEIDVVAVSGGRRRRIHLLAEVKVSATAITGRHLERLAAARDVLGHRHDISGTRLALLAADGRWPASVRAAAKDLDADLLTLADLLARAALPPASHPS